GAGVTSRENIYLALDKVADVDATLSADVTTLTGVQVVASAINDTFQPDNKGLGTNVSREEIENMPTPDRSIQNIARIDPRIVVTDRDRGAISAMGQNN